MSTVGKPAPYLGLAHFGDNEVDASYFFGRDEDARIIEANLTTHRLTVLYGPSGVGKSSLLHAGVAHGLRQPTGPRNARSTFTDAPPTVVVQRAWNRDAMGALKLAIGEAAMEHRQEPFIAEVFARRSLRDALRAWTDLVDRPLLVILDQFEEHFSYARSDADEAAFRRDFACLVSDGTVRVHALVAVRDDMFAKLGDLRAVVPEIYENCIRLHHLSREAARDAILKPLDRFEALTGSRVTVDAAVVDAVLDGTSSNTVAGQRHARIDASTHVVNRFRAEIQAPYLQLVMTRLWDQTRVAGSREIGVETLDALGGVEGIVTSHVTRSLSGFHGDERRVCAAMFKHLVTPSATKIAHTVDNLAEYARSSPELVARLLERLSEGDNRIVRPLPERHYEVFHDSLAQPILDWSQGVEEDEARKQGRKQVIKFALPIGIVMAAFTFGYAVFQNEQVQFQQQQAAHQAELAQTREAHQAELAQTRAAQQAEMADVRAAAEIELRATSESLENRLRTREQQFDDALAGLGSVLQQLQGTEPQAVRALNVLSQELFDRLEIGLDGSKVSTPTDQDVRIDSSPSDTLHPLQALIRTIDAVASSPSMLAPSSGYFLPEDFDDASTLEQTIEQWSSERPLRLGPGTFYVSQRIIVPRTIEIVGAGPEQTIIVSSASAAAILLEGPDANESRASSTEFRIEGVTLRHEGSPPGARPIRAVMELRHGAIMVERVRIEVVDEGEVLVGLLLGESGHDSGVTGTVTRSVISGSHHGILVHGRSDVDIIDNTIEFNRFRGVSFHDTAGGRLVSNTIANNGFGAGDDFWQGVALQDFAAPIIEDNRIEGNAGFAIQYRDFSAGTLGVNDVEGNAVNIPVSFVLDDRSRRDSQVAIGLPPNVTWSSARDAGPAPVVDESMVDVTADYRAFDPTRPDALKSALESLAPDEEMVLPQGTFIVYTPISVRNSLTIRGVDAARTRLVIRDPPGSPSGAVDCRDDDAVPGKAAVEFDDGRTGVSAEGTPGHFRVEHLTVQYDGRGCIEGVLQVRSGRLDVRAVRVHSDMRGAGIVFGHLDSSEHGRDVKGSVRQSTLERNDHGIVAYGSSVIVIEGTSIASNTRRGVSAHHRSSGEITNSVIGTIDDDDVCTDYYQGIGLQDDASFTVRSNRFLRGIGGYAIQFFDNATGFIADNTVSDVGGCLPDYFEKGLSAVGPRRSPGAPDPIFRGNEWTSVLDRWQIDASEVPDFVPIR